MDNNKQCHHDVCSDPDVEKLLKLIETYGSAGWDKAWKQGVTPCNLGRPTPAILDLLHNESLPMGRVLVPGCGAGYDVVAMACPGRYVVGLDISDEAVNKAKQMSSSLPNADYVSFLKEDFFSWHPTDLFVLIFDYRFFCAINPEMRSAWAQQIEKFLKPDGQLITLMFLIGGDHAGGDLLLKYQFKKVLHPMGFKAISIVDNEFAVEDRKGIEKLGIWKRAAGHSP